MVTSPVKGGRLSFSRPRTQLTFPVLRISHQFLRSQLLFVTRDACYSFSVPTLKERVPRSRLSACKKGFFLRGFLFLFSKAYVSVIGFTVSTLEALLASELLEQVPPFSVFAWLRLTATPASENSCVKRRSTKHSQTCSLKNSPLRPKAKAAEAQEAMRQQMEEQRRIMLRAVLTPAAQERLHRIQLVKADKAREVEALILQNAQRGRLADKVDEATLIELLQQTSAASAAKNTPKVTMRRRFSDDDDDF
uniref:Double-stranded DNA-binding domain-containing protein n=1 Tax=Toxoplasma gondii (strain ATCC 50861 / VEG) TaxID=432359 RepID=A0A0F7UT52_TOXGV|nr:TPA: double-stranded DNA-binding domain-containing protein [Toxoplasma gondii VEG]